LKKFADKKMAEKFAAKHIKTFAADVKLVVIKKQNEDVDFEIFEDETDRYVPFMNYILYDLYFGLSGRSWSQEYTVLGHGLFVHSDPTS
jgi:hypothetical protein